MKILFCNYEYPPLGGGGGVVMAALARQLARRHEVTALTSRAAGLPAVSDDQGVQVVRAPVFFRRQLAVANFPSMLAYLPSGLARGLALGGALRRDQHAFRRPDGPARARSRALAPHSQCSLGARRRSFRSEQEPAPRIGTRRCEPPCERWSERPTP